MDRRKFIEQAAAWSAGACLATPIFDVQAVMAAEKNPDKKSILVVAVGKDYSSLVETVLKPLGGMSAFVKRGDNVVVKPNIGWDRTPEQAANTHPEVVKAVVRQCLDAGAKRVLVFDRSVNDARRSYARSGIKAAVESLDDARAKCEYENKRDYVPVKIADGKSLDEFEFNRKALPPECDCYINVPVAKHHGQAKLTLGLKNAMGAIGGNRGIIHRDLHRRIADLNLVIRPKLTIIDATRILLRHGPTGGKLEDVQVLDTLIASADTVAADAYATTLFGEKPDYLGSTVAGARLGLGEMDLAKVEVVKA
ncbi:MAG: DUF362 domain-containing protein [Pirellulales bacterium]|nr:DUF362 domain-containing protein [Pirellulales bacterium]